MGMRIPQVPVPPMFKALYRWLKDRCGLDLYGRIPKFTNGLMVGNEEVTPELIKALKDNLPNVKEPVGMTASAEPAEPKEKRATKKTPTE